MDELSDVIRSKVNQKCIDTLHKRIKKEKGDEDMSKKEKGDEDMSKKEENKNEKEE